MDPISIISGLIGIVSAVVGIGSSVKQMADEDETQDYNRDLNQKIMDREDNSWQRAVEDRSKSGLSIAGLSSGSGSGGTVSALQPKQGAGQFANLMQNMSSQAFGLANSAYDRKLQKEIHTDQLELEKDKLKHEKLTTMFQHKLDLAKYLNIDKQIYEHNMSIAKGTNTNPLATVYGSSPSVAKEIATALKNLYNENKSTVEEFKDSATNKVNEVKQEVSNFFEGKDNGTKVPSNVWTELLGEFTSEKVPQGATLLHTAKSANGNNYELIVRDPKTNEVKHISLSKAQYEKVNQYFKIK